MARNDYGANFNGRRITHPGAYDYIDADAMTQVTSGSLNLPLVVGSADAGNPGEVRFFSGISEATDYLRGGDLLKAVQIMFSPAAEGGGGASLIGVIVTNETVSARTTIGGLEIHSVEKGEGGNRIQVKLENGTLPGTKKATVNRWDLDEVETYNNLGAVLNIRYTGIEEYAVVSITDTKLTTKVGADSATAAVDLDLDLSNDRFNTVQKLADYISTMSGYSVAVMSNTLATLSSGTIDDSTDLDMKPTSGAILLSVKEDLVATINASSSLINVASGDPNVSNFSFTYLSGGSKGLSPLSWAKYFSAAKRQFSDILVVLSGDLSIQAEALSHIGEMEKRFQKQVLFTGGPVGETKEQAKQRAASLNNSRAVVAYPGIYHSVGDNGKEMLPSYFTAAMYAGRIAGVDASEPITFDYFNVVGLEVDLLAGDPDIDELIVSGVATLERVNGGGFRLAQGVTTYTGTNNVLYREISVRRGADSLSTTMRKTLEDSFVGKKGLTATVAATPSAVQTKVVEVLEKAIKDGVITAYKDIQIRMVGTVIYVDYQVAPVEPINFILITTHFVAE